MIFIITGIDGFEWYIQLFDKACENASPADAEAWKEAAFGMYMELIRMSELGSIG